MFKVANKIAVVCFETLGIQGTNILINNGIAAGQKTGHASINIIPRIDNDGLNLQWTTITAQDEELTTVQLTLKQALETPKEEVKEVPMEEPEEEIPEEENYQLKQLDRIP